MAEEQISISNKGPSMSAVAVSSDKSKLGITSPYVLKIMEIIKQIQKRMNDSDIKYLEYSRVYDKLSREFDEFFNKNTAIFIMIIRGESDRINILAAELYYLDKVITGQMQESEIADMLAKKFMPEHLKKESDIKLKEMKQNNNDNDV